MIELNKRHREQNGRFMEGFSYSPVTQFKKGQHWRESKIYWDYDWLYNEYIVNQRSSKEIADDFGCKDSNILYFLRKHKIPIRSISEVRAIKHWGLSGEDNWMYGRRGEQCPSWNGGATPERQLFYSSIEWKRVSKVIWMKYGHCCQKCFKKGGRINTKKEKGIYQIHHIVSFAIVELRAIEDNLIVLCKRCHKWVHSRENINNELILTFQEFKDIHWNN